MEKGRGAPPPVPQSTPPPLHTLRRLRRRYFNRAYMAVSSVVILSLLYRHVHAAVRGPAFATPLALLVADVLLAFVWISGQAIRVNPVVRKEFPENLGRHAGREEYPFMDIFICTADPYKEPPMMVVNTALSVMAYDYPPDKLSVYVSDDGGSELTMFAFMEAAKFAKAWLEFCRENNIIDRNPEVYFSSGSAVNLEIKTLYEAMKSKVEAAADRRKVSEEYVTGDDERRILSQFAVDGFSRQDHPAVIQVLLSSNKDKDEGGSPMPNLIYVSREKRSCVPHHFKAGALNVLLRVSACITNSPILLVLDCDMFSNDPITAQRVLCYLNTWAVEPARPNCGFVQFPQLYHGINRGDIYNGEVKMAFQVNPLGIDGLQGPNHIGTGGFFRRRAFFGGPSCYVKSENLKLDPDHVVDEGVEESGILSLARVVAGSEYETGTDWGSKIGYLYGSLVEDFYTGFRMHCAGWQSICCDPERPAFLGDAPISLDGGLGQLKRWCIGLLEVFFSKLGPLTHGVKSTGIWMGLVYAHYSGWSIRSIPVTFYAFFSPLALLRGIAIFPSSQELWFWAYIFLFLGVHAQECYEYVSKQGTFERWWNSQRMWFLQALSSHLFAFVEFTAKHLGIASIGFNVTSKVSDEEQRRRYDRGLFEFGVPSPMFVPPIAAAILNLAALIWGLVSVLNDASFGSEFFLQMAIAGFTVVNAFPFYEAMAFRKDEGRIPVKSTVTALLVVWFLYGVAFVSF